MLDTKFRIALAAALALAVACYVCSTATGETTAYQVGWQVVAGGKTSTSSINYRLEGTVSQLAVGPISSSTYSIQQGFWSPGISFLCGDADGFGSVSVSDVVYLINYIFVGGLAPFPLQAGDVDCAGIINISDAVYLINYIFAGGPQPCAECQ